jgi:hypothetical protein
MIMSEDSPQAPAPRPWIVQELIWLLGSILGGLLVLPAMIYVVGTRMFGAYKGSGTGIGAFYSDFAHDLSMSNLPSWTLALGPLLMIYLLRLILGVLPMQSTWLITRWINKITRKSTSPTDAS